MEDGIAISIAVVPISCSLLADVSTRLKGYLLSNDELSHKDKLTGVNSTEVGFNFADLNDSYELVNIN